MNIQYDKTADAMYIYLNKGKVKKTIKLQDRLVVDVDKDGKVLGIEILDVSSQVPKREVAKVRMEELAYSLAR